MGIDFEKKLKTEHENTRNKHGIARLKNN